jgi:hypothetical protein
MREATGEETGAEPGQNKPRPAGLGRPAQPIPGPVWVPFDLATSRTIYSPLAESHAEIHSSSAAEEQRREGHRSGEERVEMAD